MRMRPSRPPRLPRRAARAQAALVIIAIALRAPALAAQPPAAPAPAARTAVVGVVRDSAGTPVPGASVDVDGAGRWAPVAPDGAFRLPDLAPGEHTVRARALGYAEESARVRVEAGAEPRADVRVEIVLRLAPTALDTVRTRAAAPVAPERRYGPSEFEARRRSGRGTFLTRAEFADRAPTRISELLLRIPGLERRPYTTDFGTTAYLVVVRGTSTIKGDVCPPAVYLDGKPFDVGKDDIDRYLGPADIDAVEVYRTGGHVPPQFSGPTARCGVIVLWSRATSAGPG